MKNSCLSFLLGVWMLIPLAAPSAGAPGGRAPAQRILDRVIARVNNEIITEAELVASLGDVDQALSPGGAPAVRETLNNMIDDRLMAQAAREEVKDIPEEMISNRVESLIKEKRQLFPTDTAFQGALEKRGWDLQSYKNYLRDIEQRTYLVQAALARRVRIKDEEVVKFSEELQGKGESLVQYRLRQIVLALPAQPPAEDLAKAEKRMLGLLEQVRQGVPFEQLARENSSDKAARTTGGDLGWLGEKELQKPILDAVRNLDRGQISQPVRTDKGLHLFQMVRMRTARELLWEKRLEEVRKSWAAELRKRAQIKILLPELKS